MDMTTSDFHKALQRSQSKPRRQMQFPPQRSVPGQLVYFRNPDCSVVYHSAQTTTSPSCPDSQKHLYMNAYRDSPQRLPASYQEYSELTFDSQFECGNLQAAYKHRDREYILQLQPDTETESFSHWYYFCVKNTKAGNFRFHIVNLRRTEPLVQDGLQPAVWSAAAHSSQSLEWFRSGCDIRMNVTHDYADYLEETGSNYHTLSFTYSFVYSFDTVYFAYSYPYSYSKLQTFLTSCAQHSSVQLTRLTKSLAGNRCYCVKITDPAQKTTSKPAVFVTSRVHPGETAGSWAAHGLLEFLLSEEASVLRQAFVFYIVPMLNPDGVRHGNSRCSLLGVDLNRRWASPQPELHPTVYYTKQLLVQVASEHELVMFCDFHGHSRLKNVFMYGCQRHSKDFAGMRVISAVPQALAQLLPSFSLSDTHYRMEKDRASTARVVAFTELGISRSYTLECSMFGRRKSHFSVDDYKQVGAAFARACLVLLQPPQLLSNPRSRQALHRSRMCRSRCLPPHHYQKPAELKRMGSVSVWSLSLTQDKSVKRLAQASKIAASRIRLGRHKGLLRSFAAASNDLPSLVVNKPI